MFFKGFISFLCHIKSQACLSLIRIGPMAIETFIRKDRPDLEIITDFIFIPRLAALAV
jgi:hypothetical protein